MTKLAFPSKEFPGQPEISLQIPHDWEPIHPAGAVMGARQTSDEGGAFVPNVVVRVDPRPADFELADALTGLRRFVAERPEGTSSEPVKVELNGRMLLGCDLAWVDDRIGTVLQAHLFESLLIEGPASGPFVQLVQITGSVGGARAQQDYPTIKAIMHSLTVEA
jgi:hypothetical protein